MLSMTWTASHKMPHWTAHLLDGVVLLERRHNLSDLRTILDLGVEFLHFMQKLLHLAAFVRLCCA